jgi:hypothetical protein
MSTESFADLGVSRAVISSLSRAGITEPFAIQPCRDRRRDQRLRRDRKLAHPGRARTLAFAIPLVERFDATDPRTAALVLAPTAPRWRRRGGSWGGFHARGVRPTGDLVEQCIARIEAVDDLAF